MAAPSPRDALILGRYQVVGAASGARGSFARVVKVVEVASGEMRALKLLSGNDTMLLDEYEVLTRLAHPSLPRVFEVGRLDPTSAVLLRDLAATRSLAGSRFELPVPLSDGSSAESLAELSAGSLAELSVGSPFFIAEWIDGGRSDDQPWSPGPDRAALLWALCADVASALAAIHAVGLIHGDVAPQNILYANDREQRSDHDLEQRSNRELPIEQGRAVDVEPRAVLVDLGFATNALSALSGDVRGTPAYMAPEALTGRIEPRSDIYGLGATLARLLLGRPPFEGATVGDLIHGIITQPPPRLVDIPPSLADLVRRMMARDPDDRPASAVAVLEELDQLAPAIAPTLARRARPAVAPPRATATWDAMAPVVEAIARELSGEAAVLEVVGVPATGSQQLVAAALQRWQLAEVATGRGSVPVVDGALDDVAGMLGIGRRDGGSKTGGISADRADELSTREHPLEPSRGSVAVLVDAPRANDPKRWLEQVARAASRADAVVVIDAREDPRAAALLAVLERARGGDGDHDDDGDEYRDDRRTRLGELATRPVIVLTDGGAETRHLRDPRHITFVAPTLDVIGVAAVAHQMLGVEPPRAWSHALHAASGGLPLAVVELVQSIADEREPFSIDWAERTSATATERRRRQLAGVSESARRIATASAVWGGRVRTDRMLATLREAPGVDLASTPAVGSLKSTPKPVRDRASLADVVELERIGLARRNADLVTIDRATADAAIANAERSEVVALAIAGLSIARRSTGPTNATPVSVESMASLLEHAPAEMTAVFACDVAERLIATGRPDRALGLARRAASALPARAELIAARAASALGSYRDVRAFADAAELAGADPVETHLVIARAAQRAGDLDAAEMALAALHARSPDHEEVAGTYARLLVTRSRFAEARAVAIGSPAGSVDGQHAPLTGLRAEAAGLASLYLGDLDAADHAFVALELDAKTNGDRAALGRALSLRGMVAQQRGQLGVASDFYREAARRLRDVGEIHAAATAELNLGTVLSERGRASEALPRLAAAGRVFAELGAITELVAADLDRGNALIAVGQLDDARDAADAALAHADGAPHLRAFALLVAGEARRRAGDGRAAEERFREALATATRQNDAHAQVSAWVCLADAGLAEALDADVESRCASDDDRDRWTVARGRLVLRGARPSASLGLAPDLARACAAVGARADAADRLDYAFRAHVVAAGLARRAGDRALARSEAERAKAAHAIIVGATAPAFRTAVEADPDLVIVAEAMDDTEAADGPNDAIGATPPRNDRRARERREVDEPPLRRLLTLSRRLNTEASVERILDEVIDTAIELTAAERGFLLLRQRGSGELAPVVSRNFRASDLDAGPSVSRSIAERAAQTGEPVVTVDAGIDERFGGAASVAALRLRSVLAVPLRQRGVITGCIYVDHRLRGGAFDEQAASVLGELADIAAIAIENARLSDELRATTRAVDELNAKLSDELADRDAELVRVKAELPDRDRLRGRYDHIVGRSLAVQRMLDVIDRAAATSLPVVVIGESGTGKELVARALHDAGPRKAGPFVAINCSAVPEPLLESELFGHVRGAFTGAERDRRGLFEVAHGGTLFLDEIADTSPGMQAKLLRVLQDGVIRRVGDTATRGVDVRIVTASRRPLAELTADGSFRDDLRYRLEVISVPVPPLRDRDGDLPLLVEHLLQRVAASLGATGGDRTKPARLTRAAMRALGQHRWPGNVRELENALARGLAMGGDVIDVDDLPEAVAAAAGRPEPAKPTVQDELRLKPALAATEQAYITAAMGRAKNNQTVAARLLGLSRFGLQKKLRRLAGETDDDHDD